LNTWAGTGGLASALGENTNPAMRRNKATATEQRLAFFTRSPYPERLFLGFVPNPTPPGCLVGKTDYGALLASGVHGL